MRKISVLIFLFFLLTSTVQAQKTISYYGSETNDLYQLLIKEGFLVKTFGSPAEAIEKAKRNGAVILIAKNYPGRDPLLKLSEQMLRRAATKKLKVYLEYPSSYPGMNIPDTIAKMKLERGVVVSGVFGDKLPPMSLLGIHDSHIIPVNIENPMIVMAKVVGFDKAEFGLADTKVFPLLFEKNNVLISTSGLSNFETGRYGPVENVKQVWNTIMGKMIGRKAFTFKNWPVDVRPAYGRNEVLPASARSDAISKGMAWFQKGHLFAHDSWDKEWWPNHVDPKYIGDPIDKSLPLGNGARGIIEGHSSNILYNGKQKNNYWIRADVQGEVAMTLAAGESFLKNQEYRRLAKNLMDYTFKTSNLRADKRNDPASPSFGLLGWALSHPGVYYGDDNARAILGFIGASAYLEDDEYHKQIVEAIMGNFRTTGKQGFRGERLEENALQEQGWQFFYNRDLTYLQPHFESWMWACYLWLYHKTGYQPLFERTKTAMKIMMEAYPDNWLWGSSMQTQRVRMLLPLSWLVRVENTPEHRAWLDRMFKEVLKYQDESGGLREEIGKGQGHFKMIKTNSDYGIDESYMGFKNGDKVTDQLYTCNFAVLGMHEAYLATGNGEYLKAVQKLADYLVRIQVNSRRYKDIDGAWFRGFDYGRWDYWGSNADIGWGVWCTLTGWMQSWIVTTLVQMEQKKGLWEVSDGMQIKGTANKVIQQMMNVSAK